MYSLCPSLIANPGVLPPWAQGILLFWGRKAVVYVEKVNELCQAEMMEEAQAASDAAELITTNMQNTTDVETLQEQADAHKQRAEKLRTSSASFTPFCTTYVNGAQQMDETKMKEYDGFCNLERRAQETMTEEEDAKHGNYFHPVLRRRRKAQKYKADRSRREYEPGQWDRCTKQIMWSPKLTPGLFTLVCMHGICYGFSFMQHHESPRTPFEIFYNRFVSLAKVSLMCVYDNACHLDRYYRAREPGMFANARVRIDRLHYKGHCACVEAYNLNTYNSYSTSLRQFNSQANEQTNSELQRVATQLHYMTGYNALYFLKRWFGQHNLRKRSAMQWQLYK